ncbi:hypothetical protein AB1046_10715 [Promicromonospora sp. Populi]|uniref:hypothetical protein n=1 Tax=Promicromonospora sp. Populi TaxID=3239420 RepID=UPI0034E26EFE
MPAVSACSLSATCCWPKRTASRRRYRIAPVSGPGSLSGAPTSSAYLAALLLDAVRPGLPESMIVTALDVLRDPLPAE